MTDDETLAAEAMDTLERAAGEYAKDALTTAPSLALSFICPARGGGYRVLTAPDWAEPNKAQYLGAIQQVLLLEGRARLRDRR